MDANDDLLNYELGEDLLDDQDDLAGDEDALLLSDEEAQLDFEDDLPAEKEPSRITAEDPVPTVKPLVEKIEPNRANEQEVEEEKVAPETTGHKPSEDDRCQSTVDTDEDRVSSTNETFSQPPPDSIASDTSPSSKRSGKEDVDYSSYDNDDEPRERHNPKTTNERDLQQNNANEFPGRNQGGGAFQRGRGGCGMGRGGPPFRGGRGNNFGRGGGFINNNINNAGGPLPPNQFNPDFHPMPPMMNNRMPGPPQMMHRPQGGPGMRPDFRPNMQQGNFHGPRQPMMRPPFDHPQQGSQQYGGPPMNPYRPHPRIPDQMNLGPRGRLPFPGNHYGPSNFNHNRMNGPQQQQFGGPHQMAPYQQPQPQPLPPQGPAMMNQGPMMGGGPGMAHNPPAMAPMMPRKVLINPNFKGGGVEAATNQLMKDTLGGAQLLPPPMSDDALLRQQEEFINKNRMHIEKRRHDRSPEPRKRDYSPPPSSHRHAGSGSRYGGSTSSSGSSNRRGHSPGGGHRESGRVSPKRRRSMDGPVSSSSNSVAPHPPPAPPAPTPIDPDEDEETRAYRLKIEKQKAMRDKILRDKELRRRRAAEQKERAGRGGAPPPPAAGVVAAAVNPTAPQATLSATAGDSSPKQLTPLVVTQTKIISLKGGRSRRGDEQPAVDPPTKRVVMPRGRVAAQVKPVVIKRSLGNDSDEFDEDELLADSPPPPSHVNKPSGRSLTPPMIGTASARRIVLATGGGRQGGGGVKEASQTATKGVFDRLERRVGVSEGAKRKLKRIVIKHLE